MKRKAFTEKEIKTFRPNEKIGLVASINPEGLIHMTLITSIMASGPRQMTLGQFCMGRGKWFIQENNNLSFLVMTLDKQFWRGKARWTHKRFDGPEFELYNEMPMFRYNSYFGVNTVHYMDLVEVGPQESLPMSRLVSASILTKLAKGSLKTGQRKRILKPFAENLFNDLGALKFMSYLGNDGFPVIIPLIQAQASDSRRISFSPLAFESELSAIKPGTKVAVYCCNLKMQSVLVRGIFTGIKRKRFVNVGVIDIDWVYNSMPPIHEQIYPEVELKPVVEF